MGKFLLGAAALVVGAVVGAKVWAAVYREPPLDDAWRDRPEEYPYRQ